VLLAFSEAGGDDRTFTGVLQHLVRGEPSTSGHDYLNGKAIDAVLVAALEEIAVSIPAKLEPDKSAWNWGAVHTNTFSHPLGGRYDLGPIPMPGGLATVSAARYAPIVDGAPVIGGDVNEGPNVRMLVELTKSGVTMRAALPTGQSMVLGDAHYADQLPLWTAAKTRACYFTRDEVVAHAPDVTTLRSR
jgi:penicillin amidase